jgi:glycosyltransferase involved in cell wall biosynthesis
VKLLFLHTHPIQYFAPLYRYLAAQGLDLEVWYFDDSSIRGAADAEFGQAVQWDIPLLEGYAYRFFPNEGHLGSDGSRGYNGYRNPALLQALRQHTPARVVVHGWSYWTYVQVLRKATRWGHQLWFRGETNLAMEKARPAWQRGYRKLMLRWLLQYVQRYGYIGTQSRLFYEYLGVPAHQMISLPYAVDNARFRAAALELPKANARQQLGIAPGSFVFLFAGKYIPKKRPLDLLQAFAGLPNQQLQLVMMGEGQLRGDMEAFITSHQLGDRVRLTGFINQGEVPLYYAAADALVMPSDYGETWGLAVNEAMNFGLPVIASDRTGCHTDLVKPGVNGFVFETGNVAALQGCMQSLLQADTTAMGKASLALVNQHSFETIARQIQDSM